MRRSCTGRVRWDANLRYWDADQSFWEGEVVDMLRDGEVGFLIGFLELLDAVFSADGRCDVRRDVVLDRWVKQLRSWLSFWFLGPKYEEKQRVESFVLVYILSDKLIVVLVLRPRIRNPDTDIISRTCNYLFLRLLFPYFCSLFFFNLSNIRAFFLKSVFCSVWSFAQCHGTLK